MKCTMSKDSTTQVNKLLYLSFVTLIPIRVERNTVNIHSVVSISSPGGGGGGDSHMKGAVMLVVSLRGVNFGFWSHLGCSGQNAIIFSREGLV